MAIPVVVTIDVHPTDSPSRISRCNEFFLNRGIPVTFLISTSILRSPSVWPALRALQRCGHELGTHAHNHCEGEVRAIISGPKNQLGFLHYSKSLFEDFFGERPVSFRSPTWCGIGQSALDELVRLGYEVDCSSTPQRPGLLSSVPTKNPWLFSSRKIRWIRDGLLEVPTSTFLLPLASPSFAMLRGPVSDTFLKLLMAEVRHASRRVLVISFDIDDFDETRTYKAPAHSWRQLIPAAWGGFQWRYWLRTYKPDQIFSTVTRLAARLQSEHFLRLREVLTLALRFVEETAECRIPSADPPL